MNYPLFNPLHSVSKGWIAAGILVWIALAGVTRSSLAQATTNSAPQATGGESNPLDDLGRRLDAVEAENAFLRGEVERLSASPDTRWSSGAPGAGCCPSCGKEVCPGLPHLCGFCFERLAWNKEGGIRIVPTITIRGEMIQSERVRLGSPIILGLAPATPGVNEDEFTVHAKTSSLSLDATGPNLGDFRTSGGITATLLNQLPLRNLSGFFVVRAYADLTSDDWRFRLGRDNDLFSPLNPSTVNMLLQKGAGNLGWFRGQFRVDRFFQVSDRQRWTVSTSLSQPDVTDFLVNPAIRGSDNGWPNVEGRLGLQLGTPRDGQNPFEFGVSGLVGQLRAVDPGGVFGGATGPIVVVPGQEVSEIWALNVDAQIHGERLGARGEFWVGEGAGTYFMAAAQSLNPQTGRPIRAHGGWGEVYYKLTPAHTIHVGFGIDDPRNQDVGATNLANPNDPGQNTLNQVAWLTWWYQATSYLRLGFEVSHRKTDYLDPTANSQGMLYHGSAWLTF